ncbi:MAG: NAD-dependent epimerase/dehydratase family protein [Burkholderiales bacterium]
MVVRRVLLLGASGFIGRHVLTALNRSGFEVICEVRSAAVLPRLTSVSFRARRAPARRAMHLHDG